MTAPNAATATPPAQPTSPATPAASTSAAPTSTPEPSKAGAQDTGFRFTQVQPGAEFLLGKTAEEAAALAAQLYQQNQRLTGQSQRAPTQSAQPVWPQQPQQQAWGQTTQVLPTQTTTVTLPTDGEFLTNPAAATQRLIEYNEAQRYQPVLQQQQVALAQQSFALVKMQRADDFKRWGPEILLALDQYAPDRSAWTPDNIAAVADIVKSRHMPEIIAEEVAKTRNELGAASVRPDGTGGAGGASPGPSNVVDFDKLPPTYRAALDRLGVKQHVIDEFLINTYVKGGIEPTLEKARERWTANALKGDIITDGREMQSAIYGAA